MNNKKNLFDKECISEIHSRLLNLTDHTPAQWGEMQVAQMLAHCQEVLSNALGIKQQKRHFLGYFIAPFIKHRYYNDEPFQRRGVPSTFKVVEEKNFAEELQSLRELIELFYLEGKERSTKAIHPMLGKFKPHQWAIGQYKHLDHHLRQFGV